MRCGTTNHTLPIYIYIYKHLYSRFVWHRWVHILIGCTYNIQDGVAYIYIYIVTAVLGEWWSFIDVDIAVCHTYKRVVARGEVKYFDVTYPPAAARWRLAHITIRARVCMFIPTLIYIGFRRRWHKNVSYSRFKNVYRKNISLMCNERKRSSRRRRDRCLRTVWFIGDGGFKKSTHTNTASRRGGGIDHSQDRRKPGPGGRCEYARVRGPKGVQLHARVRTGHG